MVCISVCPASANGHCNTAATALPILTRCIPSARRCLPRRACTSRPTPTPCAATTGSPGPGDRHGDQHAGPARRPRLSARQSPALPRRSRRRAARPRRPTSTVSARPACRTTPRPAGSSPPPTSSRPRTGSPTAPSTTCQRRRACRSPGPAIGGAGSVREADELVAVRHGTMTMDPRLVVFAREVPYDGVF